MTTENTTNTLTIAEVIALGSAADVLARLATKANALRLINLAQARIEKATAAIASDEAFVKGINDVIDSLPESLTPGSTPVIAVAVGDEVVVRVRAGKEGTTEVQAIIVAKKDGEGDKLTQYKVQVGEGFDAEYRNVFPGQVVRNLTATVGTEPEDEPAKTDVELFGEPDELALS